MWRAIGNDPILAVILAILGLTEWLTGDVVGAVEDLEESRRILQRCEHDPVAVGYAPVTLRNLGVVARSQGEYERAAEYFRESLVQARRAAVASLTGPNIARALCHLGRTVYLQGDFAQSKQLFGKALGIMRVERLAGHLLAECLEWLASVADAEGRPRDAAVVFGAAVAQWQTSGGVRYAPERPAYEAELARVKGKLAPDEFAAAWAEGRAMSREQAVDFGLHQTRLASPLQQNVSGRSASAIASSSVND